jgi:hypothetical protein
MTLDVDKQQAKSKSMIPEMRLRQIVGILNSFTTEDNPALSKNELMMHLSGSGISELTASVYISNASGNGVISRTPDGYIVTAYGKKYYS